jgi:hypothetical protein
MRPPINNPTSAPGVTDSPTASPVVRISALLEAAESLATISSSGYSEEYERGWNNAVKHNRRKLKAMAGDEKSIAEMGWCKASNGEAEPPRTENL